MTTTEDDAEEDDETFTLTLSNPANATLGTATATGTIENDDHSPLTAEFVDMPDEHDGTEFTFRVQFSDDVAIGYQDLRDGASGPAAAT